MQTCSNDSVTQAVATLSPEAAAEQEGESYRAGH